MLTLLLPPNTAWSLSSARISRLFCGFWSWWALMEAHTLLTTSGRGSGAEPTTAARAWDGCKAFIRAGLGLRLPLVSVLDCSAVPVCEAGIVTLPLLHAPDTCKGHTGGGCKENT